MDLTNNNNGFLGTFKTRDDSKAIILAKSKMVIQATHKAQVIWCGYVLPNFDNKEMMERLDDAPVVSGIWDDKGNFIDTKFRDWDLMNRISERSS